MAQRERNSNTWLSSANRVFSGFGRFTATGGGGLTRTLTGSVGAGRVGSGGTGAGGGAGACTPGGDGSGGITGASTGARGGSRSATGGASSRFATKNPPTPNSGASTTAIHARDRGSLSCAGWVAEPRPSAPPRG